MSAGLKITSAAILALFVGAYIAHNEIGARREARDQIKQHASVISEAVWTLDRDGSRDYLQLAIQNGRYEELVVKTSDGDMFYSGSGTPLESTLDLILEKVGLIPIVPLRADVTRRGVVLGTIDAYARLGTIYADLYALVLGLVLFLAARLYLDLLDANRSLDRKVQDRTKQLAESERTLQKIFDAAPTPILITRPPRGEIEKANAAAVAMLGISPEESLGKTVVESGVVANSQARDELFSELQSGRPVTGREVSILRNGDIRTVMLNADRFDLETGQRFIFSYYDLTDLRRAEADLKEYAQEMRKLYMRLGTVEEDERRLLHRELHDRIGANLSALGLELDVIGGLLLRDDRAAAAGHVETAGRAAKETIVMARDLMAELRPPALDDYGLVAALRSFAQAQAGRLGVSLEVHGADLSRSPSPFVETALFRIAQEAVLNAAKHSSATHVLVSVIEQETGVRLSVTDDGRGFDPSAVDRGSSHWGLSNMRERAQAIGAMLRIDTTVGT
jgi:PAS domain S-box-containing protein